MSDPTGGDTRESDPSAATEFDRTAVVTIQGGGVYGFSLLGQLQAFEEAQFEPLALAGTSAGAIIATLYWVGYSPLEIRDLFKALVPEQSEEPSRGWLGRLAMAVVDSGRSFYKIILGYLSVVFKRRGSRRANRGVRELTDLIGPFDPPERPFTFASFLKMRKRFAGYFQGMGEMIAFEDDPGPEDLVARFLVLVRDCFLLLWGVVLLLVGFLFATVTVFSLWRHVRNRGLFAGINLEETIEQWLRRSPRLKPYAAELPKRPAPLRFRDLRQLAFDHKDCYFPPLFLTATDVTDRKLVLFNSVDADSQDYSIARTVRASAGFPIFFRPVKIGQEGSEHWYVDGGVISNFPAWIFSHEFRRRLKQSNRFRALASRAWVHVGLRIVDEPAAQSGTDEPPCEPDGVDQPLLFFKAMASLMTGQARNELELLLAQFVPRSLIVRQPISETGGPTGILDVNEIDEALIDRMFETGLAHARKELGRIRFVLPTNDEEAAIVRVLGELIDRSLQILDFRDELGAPDNSRVRFRCSVFVPIRGKLILRYSVNMEGDPDRNIVFGFTAGIPGFVFTTRSPYLANLEKIRRLTESGRFSPEQHFGLSVEHRKQVRADRTWLLGVPIFDPSEVSLRSVRDLAPVPLGGYHYHRLNSAMDGPLLGVLGLDAAWNYGELRLAEDPVDHFTDRRVQSILGMAQLAALEVGQILSKSFAARPTT